jgi:hypothetical protein
MRNPVSKNNQPESYTFKHTFVAVIYQLSMFKLRRAHKVANLKKHTKFNGLIKL